MSVKNPIKNSAYKHARNAHGTENTEDYLELIGDILNETGDARIVDIAKKFGITQATANKTIKRLQKQGFVAKEPYRSVFLTLKGQQIASKSKRRHNIVYEFLLNLGLSKKIAQLDSEGIEHHVSEFTLKKMQKFNKIKKNLINI